MTPPPIEQAAIFLSVGRYRRAAEIMLQIIMEQEKRLIDLEKRLPEGERNFTDGLERGSDYCERCQGRCERTGSIYCGKEHEDCKCP